MKVSNALFVLALGSLLASCGAGTSSSSSEPAGTNSSSSTSASSSSSSSSVSSESSTTSSTTSIDVTVELEDLQKASAKAKAQAKAIKGGTITLKETSSYGGPTEVVMPFEFGSDKNGDVLHHVYYDWIKQAQDVYIMKDSDGSIVGVLQRQDGTIAKLPGKLKEVQYPFDGLFGYSGGTFYGTEGLLEGLLGYAQKNVNQDAKFKFEYGVYEFSFSYFDTIDAYEFYEASVSFSLGKQDEIRWMDVNISSYNQSSFIVDDELHTIQLLDGATPTSTKGYHISQQLGERTFQNPIDLDSFYATSFDLTYEGATIAEGSSISVEAGGDVSLGLANVLPETANFDFDSITVTITGGEEGGLSGEFSSFTQKISLNPSSPGEYTVEVKSLHVTKTFKVNVTEAQPNNVSVSYFVEGPDGYTAYSYSDGIAGYVGVTYIIAASILPDAANQEVTTSVSGAEASAYKIERKEIRINEWMDPKQMICFTPLVAGGFDIAIASAVNPAVAANVHITASPTPSIASVLSNQFAYRMGGTVKYVVSFTPSPSVDGTSGSIHIEDKVSKKSEDATYTLTKGEKFYTFALTHVSGESFGLTFKMSFDFALFYFDADGFANQMSKVTPEFWIQGGWTASSGNFTFSIQFYNSGEASMMVNSSDFTVSRYFSCSYSLTETTDGYNGTFTSNPNTETPFVALPLSFKVDKDFTKVDTSFSFQEKSYTLSFVPESY